MTERRGNLELLVGLLGENRLEELLLAGEVGVARAGGVPRLSSDLGDGGGLVAPGREHPGCGREQVSPDLLAAIFAGGRACSCHIPILPDTITASIRITM